MDVLEYLTSILVDTVRSIRFNEGKRAFIREHIKNAESESFPRLRLPIGHDWFNVIKPLSDSDLRGKVVVLDFFTYCCINCLHILPHLKRLEEKYSVASGLVVIGVHSAKFDNEKKSSNIALALKKLDVSHPVINDVNGYMWNGMKISCWPTMVIIGPSGHPLFILTGEQCKDELFLFVKATIEFYAGEISSHRLPICGSQILTSGILSFPAKITRYAKTFAVSDSGNHRILVIDNAGHIQFTIGSGVKGFRNGTFEQARFNSPQGLAFYNNFQIFVADTDNHAIRLIDLTKLEVTTVVGTGVQGTCMAGGKFGVAQEISSPWDVCFVPSRQVLISCNNVGLLPPDNAGSFCQTLSHTSLFPSEGPRFTTRASSPPPAPFPISVPFSFSHPECLFPAGVYSKTKESISDDEEVHNVLLIATSGTHQIWAYFLEDTIWWKGKKYEKNVCVAIAGSGREENRNNSYPMLAAFAQPSGLAYSRDQRCVFIADSESSSIRRLCLQEGAVTHVAGGDRNPVNLFKFGDVDGRGYDAKLQHPLGLTFSEKEHKLYVCDTYNNKLRKIDVSTMDCISVSQEKNLFNEPGGCVFNEEEEILYVADTNNHRIALYNVQDGTINEWVIKEKDIPEKKYDEEWEMDTEFSNNGGLIMLSLQLEPKDLRGNWKLDLTDSKIESREVEGTISSELQELELEVFRNGSGNTDVVKIIFNLTFCAKDVCINKKCLLKFLVKRVENGDEAKSIEFHKKITQ